MMPDREAKRTRLSIIRDLKLGHYPLARRGEDWSTERAIRDTVYRIWVAREANLSAREYQEHGGSETKIGQRASDRT